MAQLALGRQVGAANRPYTPYGVWGLRLAVFSYLLMFVGVPIFVIFTSGFQQGVEEFWSVISRPIATSALILTFWTAAVMTIINVVMGTLTAYVLVYFDFPGKRIFNAIIDLPIAIPTLVTGVMLVLLYGPQTPLGGSLEDTFGIRIIFSTPGIILALLFISYPFVTRAVQPVLMELDQSTQEAAYTLGASRWRTFWRVIFPAIRPAVITGGLLSFARAMGEFGSVVLVAGNIPRESLTATVYVYQQVEGGDLPAAASISVVLFGVAFLLTLVMDFYQKRGARGA